MWFNTSGFPRTACSSLFTIPGLAQQQCEGVNCQMCGVTRRLWQSSENSDDGMCVDLSRFRQRAAASQRGQRRSASHSGNTALGFESDLPDSTVGNSRRKQEHVATDRIFKLRDRVGRIENTGVAGVLKVIEKLGRVHENILERERERRYIVHVSLIKEMLQRTCKCIYKDIDRSPSHEECQCLHFSNSRRLLWPLF
jgi:hypothetical protein